MLPVSLFLMAYQQLYQALLGLIGLVFVNLLALVLWHGRDCIQPFTALVWLLGVLSLVTPVIWLCTWQFGNAQVLAAMNWPQSIWVNLSVPLICPLLLIQFVIMEKTYPRSPIPLDDADSDSQKI